MFRAFDPDRDRLVAIKLFRLDLPPERVHQLVAEFERVIAAGLTHPAIVAPVATGIEGVRAYLAQDYVAGDSLDTIIRHGPPIADALRIGRQLAGALDAAAAVHIEHGVLHPRDVLLLSTDEVRLTGLGIARAVERVGVPTQVRRPYTAPERTVAAEWGRRADVFGLAALLHEMLWARRLTATGEEAARALTEIAGGDLPRLRALFARALADDPAERFGTAGEFAGALEEAFAGSGVTRTNGAPRRPQLQPDDEHRRRASRDRAIRLRVEPTHERPPIESEPRLIFDSPLEEKQSLTSGIAAENGENAVEKEPEPVVMRADLDLRPPVLPPELIDSYRPTPEGGLAEEPSRSAISPLAFALVIGAALGFAAGFGVGTWGRSTDQAELVSSDSTVGSNAASITGTAATTGPAREFTEAEIRLKPDPTTGRPDRAIGRPDPTAAQPVPATTRSDADARKPPASTAGSLLVRSTPVGARVLVDGRDYGRTPLTVGNLSRGAHNVRVVRDGYVADDRQITITSAQRGHSVTVRLSPEKAAPVVNAKPAASAARQAVPAGAAGQTASSRGTTQAAPSVSTGAAPLTIESRPAGANVFLDGRLVGMTPLVVPGVAVGEHTLYLDHDGYQRWSSAIRVVASERNRVTASLDR